MRGHRICKKRLGEEQVLVRWGCWVLILLYVRLFVLNFTPVIIFNLFLLRMWFLYDPRTSSVDLAIIKIWFDILIPIFLVIINYKDSVRHNRFNFLPNSVFILLAGITSVFLGHLNWFITTGGLRRLDPEALVWNITILAINVFLTSYLSLIAYYGLRHRSREKPR